MQHQKFKKSEVLHFEPSIKFQRIILKISQIKLQRTQFFLILELMYLLIFVYEKHEKKKKAKPQKLA